jgi:hypothetical protein
MAGNVLWPAILADNGGHKYSPSGSEITYTEDLLETHIQGGSS